MRQTLFEKYFPTDEGKEDERLKGEELAMITSLATVVAAPGWAEFKERVESLSKICDVRPGPENAMLYQCGIRDGVRAILDLMKSVENELRREYSRA
jgi:hypothetical protein